MLSNVIPFLLFAVNASMLMERHQSGTCKAKVSLETFGQSLDNSGELVKKFCESVHVFYI